MTLGGVCHLCSLAFVVQQRRWSVFMCRRQPWMTQVGNINLLLRADVSMGSSSSTKRSPWCCYLQIFSLMDNWQEGRSLASKAAEVRGHWYHSSLRPGLWKKNKNNNNPHFVLWLTLFLLHALHLSSELKKKTKLFLSNIFKTALGKSKSFVTLLYFPIEAHIWTW